MLGKDSGWKPSRDCRGTNQTPSNSELLTLRKILLPDGHVQYVCHPNLTITCSSLVIKIEGFFNFIFSLLHESPLTLMYHPRGLG